ncbi:hypothetical protein [Vibrio gazogenes]
MFIVMPGGIGTLMQLFVIYLRNQVL